MQKLLTAADSTGITIYQANLRTYQLLRYGADVQVAAGQPHKKVHLIDWATPGNNHFALAEEVTLKGGYQRRPDIVLYVNGLVLAVLELKRSSVEVADGVRQLITNQEEIFNKGFFSTAQLVLAGSDSQGLRYGTTGTPEQFFVEWKDEAPPAAGVVPEAGSLLDRPLAQLCDKARLLDLMRNFIIFDAGQKKVPRQHQFQGVKAAQERVAKQEGGVIWHTQGSGKSILMVLIAKWLLEHDPEARVLVITDRDELDKQIVGVMRNAGVIGEDSPSPRIPALIQKWQPVLGVTVHTYFLQRMKTKWGGCNHRAGTIRLNTELVKKPKDLLEYVVVHEMLHLIEPNHSQRFIDLLDKHYPSWREARAELNELPLSAESWTKGYL